jgi:hypothetical protein
MNEFDKLDLAMDNLKSILRVEIIKSLLRILEFIIKFINWV